MNRKLAFYSDQQIGQSPEMDKRLINLIGKQHPAIGYIPSSADPERIWFKQQQIYYKLLGADLSIYFELETEYVRNKIKDLLGCDAIHLSGGLTYNFLYWLRKRELISPLREYAAQGGALIGVSAGAILMTPEISTTHLCGEEPSHNLNDLFALNLVDFAFLPHTNKIASLEKKMIEYSKTRRRKIFGCKDGDGIIVDAENTECIGNVLLVETGKLSFMAF